MELNDINLLIFAWLMSLSLVGLVMFLAVWISFFALVSPIVAEKLWPRLVGSVGEKSECGRRIAKVLTWASFSLVWILGPAAAVCLSGAVVSWFAELNKSPRLIEHGHEAGEKLQIGDMMMRWVPMQEESDSFWMLDSEVSQGLWRSVMGPHPGLRKGEDDYPIEVRNVWAVKWFLDRLNKTHSVFGWKWTVPNVNQWTTACNAGNVPDLEYWQSRAWTKENSGGSAHPVRNREPNAWGLYDMVGNAAEMCSDVGEMSNDILLVGLSYQIPLNAKLRRYPWVMNCYLYVEDDGWIFSETEFECGLRICLVPTPYAYVHSGTVLWFTQDRRFRAVCNYVAVYGFVGLLLQVLMWMFGDRIRAIKSMRWLLWLSVAEEFLRLSGLGYGGILGRVRKWTMKLVAMIFKYTVGQLLGYPISSLVASAVLSLPDPALSPPDKLLMAVVIAATFPMLLILLCIYKSVRGVRFSWNGVGRAYRYVLLPTVILTFYCLVRDGWRQYAIHRNCDVNEYWVHPIHIPDSPEQGGDEDKDDADEV